MGPNLSTRRRIRPMTLECGAPTPRTNGRVAHRYRRPPLPTNQLKRFPTAILATGMMLLAWLAFVCGLVLDTVTRGRWEMKRLHYLTLPPPGTTG